MQNKKTFLLGSIFGIIITILSINIFSNLDYLYRKFISGNFTISQKVKEIEKRIDKHYVNEYDKNNMKEIMYKSMVLSLKDPYSYYLTKNELKDFLESTEGNYVGIGITVSVIDNEIVVNKVFENSPAEKSGIKTDDRIVKINGENVNGEKYQEAVLNIKGEEGTKVKLSIFRKNENKTLDLEILRESIDVPTVEHKMLKDNIGYIAITQFDRVTYDQFKLAFEELKNAKGLIIDLRDNPGGLLTVVNKIADLLLPEGNITYIETKDGEREYYKSDTNHYGKPLVVLVNKNSASASEVLSGAIKDYKAGVLVGEQTFGKGVVQDLFQLSDGSAVKLTIAKYYTPNGICIDGTGITPDYIIYNPEKFENSTEDVQLERAISLINEN